METGDIYYKNTLFGKKIYLVIQVAGAFIGIRATRFGTKHIHISEQKPRFQSMQCSYTKLQKVALIKKALGYPKVPRFKLKRIPLFWKILTGGVWISTKTGQTSKRLTASEFINTHKRLE